MITMRNLPWLRFIGRAAALVAVVCLFLVAIELMVVAVQQNAEAQVRAIFQMIHNPFVALFVGILTTALVQSSSMTTSITVALTAAGVLTYAQAVPVIIGANIGTTLTCFLVTLGHVMRKKEFRRAVSGSALHMLFNLLTAFLLFPLEFFGRVLSGAAHWLAQQMSGITEGWSFQGLNHWVIHPLAEQLMRWVGGSLLLTLGLAFLLIIAFIRLLSLMFRGFLEQQMFHRVSRLLTGTSWRALFSGLFLTILVQSSSLTTSLIVTAVASNRLPLGRAFWLIMGANIGTTLTALLASLGHGEAALTIALTHVLFNLCGICLLAPWTPIREGIVHMVSRLGRLHVQHRMLGFVAVLLLFFVLPFLLIYTTRSENEKRLSPVSQQEEQRHPDLLP